MTDPLRIARALVDEVRLLPEEEREAVLQGARLRRDALGLASKQPPPDAAAVRAMIERFRRARGLLTAAALDAWLAARASHREDFGRWIRDEAALQSVGLDASHLAPRDIVDFARVAEGADALWDRARAAASTQAPADATPEDVARYFDALGLPPPQDFEAWSQRAGFDDVSSARAAIARHLAASATPRPRSERVEVGDAAPDFTLPHPVAGAVRCADLAGQTVVLALAPNLATGRALRDRWDASAFSPALVIARNAGDDGARVPWLHDAAGAVWSRYGLDLARALHVVLDAAQRVRWMGEDAGEAEARALALGRTPDVDATGAPVLVVPGVFDAAECATLIERWHEAGHDAGAITAVTARGTETYADASIKRRGDHLVTDPALDAWIRERLERRVFPTLVRAFHFAVESCEAFRIGCYDAAEGGHFRAHRDDENPATAQRRFALSMNLDPDAYEGGRLRLPEFGATLHPPRGAAVVYSASLLHEVTPVTRGRRFVLVGFLRGTFR